jgi:hypothetical protein
MMIKNLTLITFVLLGAGSNAIGVEGNTEGVQDAFFNADRVVDSTGSSRQLRGNPSSFELGLARGQSTAGHFFRDMDRRRRFDCANAVGNNFRNRIDDEIIARGKDGSGDNFRETAFNLGFRAGMEQGLNDIERQCLDDSPDECIELGNLSAQIIAARHCGLISRAGVPDFQAICREVGINHCRGSVFNQATDIDMCGSPTSRDLLRLQNECEDTVDMLLN